MAKKRLSKREMVSEMIKCTQSAEYYLGTYGMVYHPKKGHVKFNLFQYQRDALNSYQKNRFNISLKSRQTGFSTLTAGYIAWMIIFHRAKEIVVVANKQDNAQGFIRKIKTFIKKTPDWMVPAIESDNKKSIELANSSKVSAQATTGDAGRSESLSLLVIDEAAIIDTGKVDDLWAAAYPTLSLGGSAIIISTPKGVGNWYHQQWEAAVNKESDFVPIVAHWTEHPVYGENAVFVCQLCKSKQKHGNMNPLTEAVCCDACGEDALLPTSPWYEEQCKQLGDPRKVAQELDMDFLGSGDQVISEQYIKEIEKGCKPPIRVGGWDNNLWIWREPEEGHGYLITADVARGDGSDFSACHVLDIETREQVAEYKGKLPPDLYAKFLTELGYDYNDAMLVVEANSIGYATCLKLVDMEYPNIFYSMKGMHGQQRRKMEKALLRKEENMVPGFQTTLTTRPLIISQLEQDVRTKAVTIRSTRTISELRTLVYHNGRPEAMHKYNDDLVMSLSIGLFVMVTTLNDMLATKESILASLRAMGSYSGDAEDLKMLNQSFSKSMRQQDAWSMVNTHGESEDLRWLIGKK